MKTANPKANRASSRPDKRPLPPSVKPPAGRPILRPGVWFLLPALMLATLAAYYPAWHGGMLWDDDSHITRPALRSADGLWRIWFDLGATQQYYPVVHSAFWLQHRLWGDNTTGYHIVNILLHALAAFLIALLLRRLAIPGAPLAALIFALHPVHVESVAWIAELKNTLSAVFYLAAALAYLRFDTNRRPPSYALALLLFLFALLSKSVTATLPAALLVLFWWKRGSLSWHRDLRPLLPFFALGLAAGVFTAWVEKTFIGAQGSEFQASFLERSLIAGRAVCFYLGKLLWPANLTFIYPRWQVSSTAWWQFLFPLALLALLAALWLLRKRSRAPLAAFLLFCGTLFPALGFIDVFPFRYSFVADHFQYLATIPVFALFAAALAILARRLQLKPIPVAAAAVLVPALALGFPARNQSRQYADAETLYRATLSRNPQCWMAHSNLGMLKINTNLQEAVAHFQEALRLKPDLAEAHSNLGNALQRLGRMDEAMAEYRKALRFRPDLAEGHNNLGNLLIGLGRAEEAVIECERALQLDPDYPEARHNLGKALLATGHPQQAIAQLTAALASNPENYIARRDLGDALQATGRSEEAVAQYHEVLGLRPDFAEAYNSLGNTLVRMGRPEEAIMQYRQALRLLPGYADAHNNLGFALQQMGRVAEAVERFKEALRLKPDFAAARYNLGNALVRQGRREEAAAVYREALKRTPDSFELHNNLGVALEGMGRLKEAMAEYKEALRLNPDSPDARENVSRISAILKIDRFPELP